ncbi:MAG TPA: S9 family peptidase [Candidatus Limnocylindrales bacterium]|nr:S9 family peptidase [Candidatus Limnocylindrales bacterium]
MVDRHVLPYGSWPSPISIEMAVAGNLGLSEPRLSGNYVYWTEGRPQEKGRQVIVRWTDREEAVDVTPPGYNARTMAHEYGGGWYAVDGRTVYFSNIEDGRIHRQESDSPPVPITDAGPFRYGDLVVDRAHGRLLCVREDMSAKPEPKDELIAIDLDSGTVTVLASGYDFYNTPRPTSDGRRIAWLSWRHPNMPWDSTELWVADLDESGAVSSTQMVAGGGEESVVQPEWAPDGSLVFVSDRTGWWNLYRWLDGTTTALAPSEAEFAGPLWVFGLSWYGIADDGTIVAVANRQGSHELWMIPATGGSPERIDVPDAQIDSLQLAGRRICYLAGGPSSPRSVVLLDLDSGERRVLRQSYELTIDSGYISTPQPITFPTTDGHVAHALYYPPTSLTHTGPADELPPLIVTIHGGPTSGAGSGLSLGKQVFTSRGFGVVDVNYRGSTGYGREYMRLLDGKWGVYDVDDCVAAARFLGERGDVDERRMAIRGGSAGGYTTLCALAFHDAFAAGASHFGVADLEALARDTHKFESRYTDRLVAPYPERIDIYRERSPIYQMDRITSPLIVLQGRDDKVVPIGQAEQIVAALRKGRTPHAYLVFDGEGHGFRQAANIRRALEAELSFYAQVFGFELADSVKPTEVEFLA